MSAAVATPGAPAAGLGSAARTAAPRNRAGRLFRPSRPTLDERISGLWEQLVEEGTIDCPVCGNDLLAGRECGGCGSELS